MIKDWLSKGDQQRPGVPDFVNDSKWSQFTPSAADVGDRGVFYYLTGNLARSVGVDCAWIAETVIPSRSLRTLALFMDGRDLDRVEYEIADTPARSIFEESGFRLISANIQRQYPLDRILHECDAFSYADVPLVSASGEVLGLLAVASRRSLSDNRFLASQMRLCANRATTELERRKADADLRAREARLRLLFEHAPDAHVVLTLDGKLIEANQAAEKLTGLTRTAMIGRNVLLPGLMPDADIRRAVTRLQLRAAGAAGLHEEFTILHRDGRALSAESSAGLVHIDGEQVMLVALRDITGRKEAEKIRQRNATLTQELQKCALDLAINDALSTGDFFQIARHVTRTVCAATRAQGVSIWLVDRRKAHLLCADRFDAPKAEHSAGDVRLLTECGSHSTAQTVAPDPDGPGHFLEVAIRVSEQLAGILRVRHKREGDAAWEPAELRFLDTVSSMLTHWLPPQFRTQ